MEPPPWKSFTLLQATRTDMQRRTVIQTLQQASFDFANKPVIEVWNKIDLLTSEELDGMGGAIENVLAGVDGGDDNDLRSGSGQENEYSETQTSPTTPSTAFLGKSPIYVVDNAVQPPVAAVPISALTAEGVDLLRDLIAVHLKASKGARATKVSFHIATGSLVRQWIHRNFDLCLSDDLITMSACGEFFHIEMELTEDQRAQLGAALANMRPPGTVEGWNPSLVGAVSEDSNKRGSRPSSVREDNDRTINNKKRASLSGRGGGPCREPEAGTRDGTRFGPGPDSCTRTEATSNMEGGGGTLGGAVRSFAAGGSDSGRLGTGSFASRMAAPLQRTTVQDWRNAAASTPATPYEERHSTPLPTEVPVIMTHKFYEPTFQRKNKKSSSSGKKSKSSSSLDEGDPRRDSPGLESSKKRGIRGKIDEGFGAGTDPRRDSGLESRKPRITELKKPEVLGDKFKKKQKGFFLRINGKKTFT